MKEYIECPNCIKDKFIVPLRNNSNSRFCPLCESIFRFQCSKKGFC